MRDQTTQARLAAAKSIASDLQIDLTEAQRWCDAWDRYAKRHRVARGQYFWDAGRGWIDAQRSFEQADHSLTRAS